VRQTPPLQSLGEYLTVGEAAEFLGVSPWTLRNWDRDGKFQTLRHPKNGYRIYRREDLEAILQPKGLNSRLSNRLTPLFDWTEVGESDHFVQFYEDDDFLVASVSRFLGAALGAGDGAVLIATRAHRQAIQRKLRAQGLNLAVARAQGQFVALDAAETLAKFMVDGVPDPARFRATVGEVMEQAARGRLRARAFGEMVALLWAEGNRDGAIRLEELWNDLQKAHVFALYCAYPLRDFGGEGQEAPFANVCTCHSRVIPAESYAALAGTDERLEAIARLQQKAQALEAEVAQRQQAEAALRQADHRKDEFLATLAHELRNPLAPIRNALHLMHLAGDSGPAVGQAREMIERQVGHMVRLVDDLLEVTRITRGKVELRKERVTLSEIVASAVETSRPFIEAGEHELSVSVPPEPIELKADATRLAQVLVNLLNNAAKYTDPGGRIRLAAAREGNQVTIRVRDTGIGICPEVLPHIFDMFMQAERSYGRDQGGLGIGLTLVRRLVEMHDGSVEAHSDGPGHGSEFVVRLPLAPRRR
jgi:signal transduction histidine kinase